MKFELKNLPKQIKAFWKEPPKGRYLNLKEIFCLGGSALGISFITNLIATYVTIGQLPLIYDMGKYATLHATLVYLIASVIGMIVTPIYGNYVQRTNTKWGRYKPYILFMAPVVGALGTFALWSPQNLTETQRIIYVYCMCIPTLVIWQLWFNAWNMFPGVFSPNQQERVDIWSPIGLVIGFAPTVMNIVKDLFAGWFGDIMAVRVISIFCLCVGVSLTVCLVKVKERVFVTEKESEDNKLKMSSALKMIFKNKPLMILMIALVLGSMRTTIDMVWNIVGRVKYANNMADGAKIFGAVSVFVGFAATPNMVLLPLYTRKLNNRGIMMIWQACNFIGLFILSLVGYQNIPTGSTAAIVITALRFVVQFNAIGSLLPLMLSEIGDYQQAKSGYRLDGYIQTMAYAVPLLATQVLALVPALIQAKIGFNPNDYIIVKDATNVLTPELVDVANRYANIATWVSAVSSGLMFIALIMYPLSKKKHAEIVAQLQAESVNADVIEAEAGEGLNKVVEELERKEAEKQAQDNVKEKEEELSRVEENFEEATKELDSAEEELDKAEEKLDEIKAENKTDIEKEDE